MSYGDLDLQLSDLNPNDHQALVGKINSWMQNDIQRKNLRAASWSQAIHFLIGNQWLQYNAHEYRWDVIPYTEANKNIDRPVTNHILRWTNQNVASFTNRPTFIVEPNSEDPNDKIAANVSKVIQSFLWDDLYKGESYNEAALWGLSCGTAFRKSYKKHIGKHLEIPNQTQMPAPAEAPSMMNPGAVAPNPQVSEGVPTESSASVNQDKSAPPEEQEMDKVDLRMVDVEIVSPFNITFDGLPKRWRDVNIIMEASVRKLSWIRDQYMVDAPGYTGKAKDVKEEKVVTNILALSEGLKNLVEGSVYSNATTTASGYEIKDAAVVKEVYVRPTKKFPRGRLIVVAGDQLVYQGHSPFLYKDGKIWHPYTSWGFMKQPGSIWGISLVQQLVPIQRRINSIDALISYNRKTMAVGTWLIPAGSGIADESMVGIPGQNITYTPDLAGVKPEKVAGQPLPTQVMEERQMLIRDGDLLSIAGDIRSGQNPAGVNTLGQLQILTEQANQARSKQVEGWEKFIEESEELDLLNFQDCYKVPDPEFISNFKKYSKDISGFDWESFIGQDIQNKATIKVENGSTLRRSKLVRESRIMQLIPTGLLGDVSDPFVNNKLLEEFGLSSFGQQSNLDVKKAEHINDMMLAGQEAPPLLEVDDPDVHLIVVSRFMKTIKYMELEPDIQILFQNRFEELANKMAEVNQRAQMTAEPAMPQQPGQAPELEGMTQPPATEL